MDPLSDAFPHEVHKPVRQMKIIVAILIALVEALVIALSFYAGVKTGENKILVPESSAPAAQPDNTVNVTGVVRTAGLSDDEKSRFRLESVEYQITDMTGAAAADGYFLLPNSTDYSLYNGSCVTITGVPKQQTEEFMYGRQLMAVADIRENSPEQCSPYSDSVQTGIIPEGIELETFTGTVTAGIRPAPDIGYDYILRLDTSYLDTENASGLPQNISSIVIVPATNTLWRTLQNSMNQQTAVEGYMLWGYAESKYFLVTDVLNPAVESPDAR